MAQSSASQPLVDFHNVSVMFGDNPMPALQLAKDGQNRAQIAEKFPQNTLGVVDCNLQVQQGEIMVLMGLSGSGKTTLLRTVNGLNPITDGAVNILDGDSYINIAGISDEKLCYVRTNLVAKVFQNFALLPWRNVADNVALGLEISGVPMAERMERVHQQLEIVGLTGMAHKKISELSGGMQQRVGLARAFTMNAPLLLMDEPFSALDPLIRTRMQDELLSFREQLQSTIIFVSHDLDEAIRIGSRIAIMQDGRIVQCDAPVDILLKPKNQYVRDFVAHINPLNVLTANELMLAGKHDTGKHDKAQLTMPHDTPMEEIIAALLSGSKDINVSDGDKIIGMIDYEKITKALSRNDGGDRV